MAIELTFEPDGDLSKETVSALRGLPPAELGSQVVRLIGQLNDLDGDQRKRARSAIERAIADLPAAGIDVRAEIPALIGTYLAASVDPARSGEAELAVRLLATVDRARVMAAIPIDSAGLELRVRLGRALDDATGTAAEPGHHSTRGIDVDATRGREMGVAIGRAIDEVVPELTHAEPPEPTGAEPPEPAGAEPPEPAGAEPPEPAGAEPPPPMATPTAPSPAPAHVETYKAYGVLECDELVLVGATFPLTVGLGERPSAGVSGPAMSPPVPVEPYDLEVQLFADGFDVAAGESLRLTLQVSNEDRYPTAVVHMTARPMPDRYADREISAAFVIAGEPLGAAQRNVRVTKDAAEVATTAAPEGGASGTNITAPTGDPKAHVTIIIKRGLAPGSLQWSVESDLPGVRPDGTIPPSDIGDEPVKFTKNLIGQIRQREGGNSIFSFVEGVGSVVADEMPTEVIHAIRAAHEAVKPDRLQILILTDEPFVPWELAWLDPPLDPTVPGYLGAGANVGRWVYNAKTPTDPRRAVKAGAMAVVSGIYTDMERLLAAEEESKQLQKAYHAIPVDAQLDPVMSLLRGTPAADIIHFAVHGKFDAQGYDEGIYLVEGPPLVPLQVRTGRLKDRAPFVFLNACQLGSSAELLGDYYGTAEAFLRAGASAVVAPLWSVDDEIAQQIALGFYEKALAKLADPAAEPPLVADLLREVRLGIVTNADKQSATYLAYQFYGHPSLRLSWAPAA